MTINANLKVYNASTWVDPQEIKIYQSGAWANVANVYYRQAGSWVEVWPTGAPPSPGINTGVFHTLRVILYGAVANVNLTRASLIEPDVRGESAPFYNYVGANDFAFLINNVGRIAEYKGTVSSGPYSGGDVYDFRFDNLVEGEGTSRTAYTPVFECDATSGTVNVEISWYDDDPSTGNQLGNTSTSTTSAGANVSMLNLDFSVTSTLSGNIAVMTGSTLLIDTSPPPYSN
jgi:hypothetical protein